MELSVDEKIQAAIQPLLDRIAALQAENQHFKQQITTLQAANQPKAPYKPGYKPGLDHNQRPATAKPVKKSNQHHEVKPDLKGLAKPGAKKQETKVQHEEGKGDTSKVGTGKTPATGSKVVPSPHTNKDTSDSKNPKVRSTTGLGTKPNTGVPSNKSGVFEKKTGTHKTEGEQEKKEEKQEKKSHTSKEKDHKVVSNQGLKSPGPAKVKAGEKPADKKPAPKQNPTESKAHGLPKTHTSATTKTTAKPDVLKSDAKVAKLSAEKQVQKVQKVQEPNQVQAPEELAKESPYTPVQGEKKQESPKEEVSEQVPDEKKEAAQEQIAQKAAATHEEDAF